MSDTLTSLLQTTTKEDETPPSGDWSQDFQGVPTMRPGIVDGIRAAGAALVLITSSSSAGLDLWLTDYRFQTSSVFMPLPDRVLGVSRESVYPRRISLAEAGDIALRILLQAEQERLRIADEEARRLVIWETTQ